MTIINLLFPSGRLNRARYLAVIFPVSVVGAAVSAGLQYGGMDAGIMFVLLFFGYIGVCAAIKRFHDLDKSGFFILLGLIPIASLYLLVLLFQKGTEGPNRFGEDLLKRSGGQTEPSAEPIEQATHSEDPEQNQQEAGGEGYSGIEQS